MAIIVIIAFAWLYQSQTALSEQAQLSPVPIETPVGNGLPSTGKSINTEADPAGSVSPMSNTELKPTMPSSSANVVVPFSVADLGLVREFAGNQAVNYGGVEHRILGTKLTSSPDSQQTVLVVRDETTGKIDYWQSGLRIVLKSGNDYEAFVQEHSRVKRGFVNSEQAQVMVDATDIAAEFSAIAKDPRVSSVEFLQLKTPVSLK